MNLDKPVLTGIGRQLSVAKIRLDRCGSEAHLQAEVDLAGTLLAEGDQAGQGEGNQEDGLEDFSWETASWWQCQARLEPGQSGWEHSGFQVEEPGLGLEQGDLVQDGIDWEPAEQLSDSLEQVTQEPTEPNLNMEDIDAMLSQLTPVAIADVSEHMQKQPLPSIFDKPSKTNKPKRLKKAKESPDSTKSKVNKNQSLREEQAAISQKFNENIAIKENSSGIKYFQCKLCQVFSFQLISDT